MKLIFIILLHLFSFSLLAQSTDTLQKFKVKNLKGYFVFVRDSIPETPSDVYLARWEFDIYFIPEKDSSIIYHLERQNFPPKNGAVFVGGSMECLTDYADRSNYSKWLTQNNLYSINDRYTPFDRKKLPKELIESRLRSISVYKGNIEVIGPFLPFTRHDIVNLKVFLYFPSNVNETDYLFTIFFPSK